MADNFVQRYAGKATGNQNALSVPDTVDATLTTLTDTQTLTNKTLTSPTITGATLTTATITTPTMTITTDTVAAAGNAIGNATAITTSAPALVYVTAADGTKGVQLPATAAGKLYIIKNADAANAVLKVYPPVNSSINAITANSSLDMAANTAALLVAYNSTLWFSTPLLPS